MPVRNKYLIIIINMTINNIKKDKNQLTNALDNNKK